MEKRNLKSIQTDCREERRTKVVDFWQYSLELDTFVAKNLKVLNSKLD